MAANEQLLDSIQQRQQKRTEFGYGIITADKYVSTVAEAIGADRCNQWIAKQRTSFDDVLRKAAQTLVYSNNEMVVEDIYSKSVKLADDVELPKNTLMVFRHVLTSSRKDRDGDILRTKGAVCDPRMLLLWQHVHTLPIGKMLQVYSQNKDRLELISCIVDMNDLSHDSAVMIENGMGRFSHGFRALQFEEIKAPAIKPTGPLGFDVKEFEIMEESLVSVPSNVDAGTEEVLLSLVDGGKLTSPLMKEYGVGIRRKQPVSVPGVEIRFEERIGNYSRELIVGSFQDLKAAKDAGLIGVKDEDELGDGSKEAGEAIEDDSSSSEEADVKADDEDKERTEDKEVECPKCGAAVREGKCTKCSYEMKKDDEVEEDKEDDDKSFDESWKELDMPIDVKLGRTLNKANEFKIRNARENIREAYKTPELLRSCKALMSEAGRDLTDVLMALDGEDKDIDVVEVKEMTLANLFEEMSKRNRADRDKLFDFLNATKSADDTEVLVGSFSPFLSTT